MNRFYEFTDKVLNKKVSLNLSKITGVTGHKKASASINLGCFVACDGIIYEVKEGYQEVLKTLEKFYATN